MATISPEHLAHLKRCHRHSRFNDAQVNEIFEALTTYVPMVDVLAERVSELEGTEGHTVAYWKEYAEREATRRSRLELELPKTAVWSREGSEQDASRRFNTELGIP